MDFIHNLRICFLPDGVVIIIVNVFQLKRSKEHKQVSINALSYFEPCFCFELGLVCDLILLTPHTHSRNLS